MTVIVTIPPAFLNREAAAAYVSLSETTLEDMVRRGEFPRPRRLSGNRVGWRLRELDEWSDQRPESDLPPPRNTSRKAVKAAAAA